jgi:TPR repeat protein
MTRLKRSHLVALFLGILFAVACAAQTPPKASQAELLKKAQTGDSDAQYQLGMLYELGSSDTQKDPLKAFEWLHRSAESGNPKAETNLGVVYWRGDGVAKDDAVGFTWLYKAALQGFPAAQERLAGAYARGIGTPKNESAAFDWYLKAALNGDAISQLGLCDLYQKPASGEMDPTMAYAWCSIAQESASHDVGTHKAYTDKQLESLKTYAYKAQMSLSVEQLQEAVSLASMWTAGHSSGATMPRHSRSLLALASADVPAQRDKDDSSKTGERTKHYVRSANGCEAGHWVDSVLSDGDIVKLDDGTIWKIDAVDTVNSTLWLDADAITVCAEKLLMDTDDKTSAGAHQIH